MHGLIFVTWEKFLSERFKGPVISQYRAALEGKVPPALLMSRVYNDDLLLAAVGAASEASKVSVDKLLKDYGRFFILALRIWFIRSFRAKELQPYFVNKYEKKK